MLQKLRQVPSFIKFVLWAVILVMVLGIGYSVTAGLGDLVRGKSSGMSGPWIARVGSETITQGEYEGELRQIARQMEQLGLADQPGFQMRIRFQALQSIVRKTLELHEAEKAGLRVTNDEVSDRIRSMPELQRDGQFVGLDAYKQLLANNSIDVGSFERTVRDGMLIQKWEEMVGAGATVSDREVDEELARRNQKVRFDYVLLESGKFADSATIADDQLNAYYTAHRDRYRKSESRRARYVLIEVKDTDPQVPAPSDDEVRQAYEASKARYPGEFEQVKEMVRKEVLFQKAQAEADRRAAVFRATIPDAAGFEAQAAKSGYTVQDSGWLQQTSEPPAGLGPAFLSSLFAAQPGSVAGPVRTIKGNALLVVAETQPAREATFEESRADVRNDVMKERGTEAARTAATKALAGAGDDLSKVAKTLGATVQNGTLVSKGEAVPGLGYDAAVEGAAFALDKGKVSSPIMTKSGSVVVLQIAEKVTPNAATIASDKESIREELMRNRQVSLVNAVLDAAAKATEIKTNEEYFKQFGA